MKLKVLGGVLVLMVLNFSFAYAQIDNPCDGSDPDNTNCPLDTWVFVLAIIAVIFTAVHLRKKDRLSLNAADKK